MGVQRGLRLLTTALAVLALAGCSTSAREHFERGELYLKNKETPAAVLEFRNAIEKDPTFAPAYLRLAEVYLQQENAAGALEAYVRAADLMPSDVDVQLKAGAMLLASGRSREALARAEKALATDGRSAEAIAFRASALAGLGQWDNAATEIKRAIAIAPTARRLVDLGTFEFGAGRRREAEAAFRKAIELDPRSPAARLSLGQLLASAGRATEAEDSFKAAVAVAPDSVVANALLAEFYSASDRAADAEPFLRKLAENASDDPAPRIALAEHYVRMRRRQDALRVLEGVTAPPAAWVAVRPRLASLLYEDGQVTTAHRVIDDVIVKHPGYADARIVKGRFLLAEGREQEALKEAHTAIESQTDNAAAHRLLAEVHETRKDLDAAAAAYQEVLRLRPRDALSQVKLAAVQLRRGDSVAATQLAQQAVSQLPTDLEARLVLARSLLERGDLERAGPVVRALVETFPQVGAAHAQAGLVALRRGDAPQARAAFEQALALDARLLEPLAGLAALDIREGHVARARSRVETRLAAAPRDGAVLLLAANTRQATGDTQKAEEFLRRAIASDPNNFAAYTQLGRMYVAQAKLDKALAEFEQLAARQPLDGGPATMAAMIVQAQGNEEEARRRYEAILGRDPHAAVAANNLAYIYANRGEQLDRALVLARAAKAGAPDDPSVSDTLALVYIKKDLGSLAIPLLEHAAHALPEEPVVHYHRGLAYAQTGNKDAARQALERALSLTPTFNGADEARLLLGQLR